MTLDLSEICRRATGPVEDHLWQSTLFSLAVASLTILLKDNAARHRFTIWFVASTKFFVPFWLLTHLGAMAKLQVSSRAPVHFVTVVEFASTPFERLANDHALRPDRWSQLRSDLPMYLGMIWALGAMVVLSR